MTNLCGKSILVLGGSPRDWSSDHAPLRRRERGGHLHLCRLGGAAWQRRRALRQR